ncbi:MAG: hypothetical protein U1E36_09475 [Rickettsiales bacterium]
MNKFMTIGALAALGLSLSACDTWHRMWSDNTQNRSTTSGSVSPRGVNDHDAGTNRAIYDNMQENYPGNWYESPKIRHRDR